MMPNLRAYQFKESFPADNFLKLSAIADYRKSYSLKADTPHTYNYYLIIYTTSGTGKQVIDFKKYPIHKHSLYLIAPGQIHQFECSKDTKGFHLVFEEQFFCSGIGKKDLLLTPPFFRNGASTPYIKLDDAANDFVQSIFTRIQLEIKNNLPGKWDVIRSLLNILINKAGQLAAKNNPLMDTKHKRSLIILSNFHHLAERHYTTQKHIQFYADKLGITANHLTETIREVSGETPIAIIRKRTLLEAKRRLLAGKDEVKVIAYDLGFENTSYFIKLFKRDTGLTPAAYQKKALLVK